MTGLAAKDSNVIWFPESRVAQADHKGKDVIGLPIPIDQAVVLSALRTVPPIPVEYVPTHLGGVGSKEVVGHTNIAAEGLPSIGGSVRVSDHEAAPAAYPCRRLVDSPRIYPVVSLRPFGG